jgi:hypothetical protein
MAVPYKLNYFEIESGLGTTSTFLHKGDLTANRIIKIGGTSNDILLGDGSTGSLSGKQNTITLTTSGTSGAATLIGATLNIPNYSPDLTGYVTLGTTQTITGAKTFGATITSNRINATATGSGAAVISALAFDNAVAGSFSNTTTFLQNNPTLFVQQGGDGRIALFQSGTANVVIESDGDINGIKDLTLTSAIKKSTIGATYTYDLPNANGTIALVGGAGVGTVTSVAALTLGTTGTDLSSTVADGTTTPVITLNVPTASATNRGALSSADWSVFNGKQAAGNYITSLTGEATASGPGAASVTLDNTAVIGKVLTGLNITGGTVVSTDSILTAFGKLQNELNGLIGGSVYQGTWNANTNTPTLTSSVGTKGHYYIVSVAGSTNLNGITEWSIGDWAIYDGSAWQKVDNTDAVVTVNGYSGIVSLVTGDVLEGAGTLPGRPSQLYFTDARARAAISLTTTGSSGAATYDNGTGVLNIPNYGSALSGYVPYTGATANLDLGTFDITTDIVNLNQLKAVGSGGLNIYSNSGTHIALLGGGGGAGTTFYGGIIGTSASFSSSGSSDTVGITHPSGSGIALNITKSGNGEGIYVNKLSGSGNAVTIVGTLNATTLVKNGGTSSQFLKADGSVDSTSYGTGSVTSVAAITLGTSGFDLSSTVANGTTTPVITLNVPNASEVARGVITTGTQRIGGTKTFDSGLKITTGTSTAIISATSFSGDRSYGFPTSAGFLTTTVSEISSGIAKFDSGNRLLQAVAGTDYVVPSALSAYLPLSGGTLTGALTGTSATFTGNLFTGGTFRLTQSSTVDIQAYTGSAYSNLNYDAASHNWQTSGGTAKMVLNSSGNLGLGVTPSAWGTNDKSIDIGGSNSSTVTGLNVMSIGKNAYFDGSNWRYTQSSIISTLYQQSFLGNHVWYNAPSGTAGNAISFTQAMTLNASGNLGIGTTSPGAKLNVSGGDIIIDNTTTTALRLNPSSSSFQATIYLSEGGSTKWEFGKSSSTPNFYFYSYGTSSEVFKLNYSTGAATFSSTLQSGAITIKDGGNNGQGTLNFGSTNGYFIQGGADYTAMNFYTNATERMRITSGGDVLIGSTSAISTRQELRVGGNSAGSRISLGLNGTNYSALVTDSGGNVYLANEYNDSAIKLLMINYNNGVYLSQSATSWTANSDERLKDINGTIENAVDKLLTLRAVNFSWKKDENKKEVLGLIAQDVEKVFPQIIDKNKIVSQNTNNKDETEYLGVRYTELIPVLVKAIQEQQAQIEELKALINK